MKKLLLAIVAAALLMGCVNCPPCPPERAVILIPPYGPAIISEGFFDTKENWATESEFDEWMKKQLESGV